MSATRAAGILILLVALALVVSGQEGDSYADSEVITYELEEPFPNAQPTIKVGFGEEPVDVTSYNLAYDKEGYDISTLPNLEQHTDDQRNYEFTLPDDKYLISEDYRFTAEAEDADNNIVTINILFTVETQEQPIYLDKPVNHHLENTTFGVANHTPPFNLSIRLPDIPAENCKWALAGVIDDGNLEPESLYNFLGSEADFENHGPDNKTFYNEDFDRQPSGYQEGTLYPVLIVCKEVTGNYTRGVVSTGYDTTPPDITARAQPSTIDDPNHVESTLNVTTDDQTVCNHTTTTYPSDDERYQLDFPPATVRDIHDYTTNILTTLDFNMLKQEPPPQNPPYEYEFDTTCENIAGFTTTTTTPVTIEYDAGITITKSQPPRYASEKNIDFEFETNWRSVNCTLTLDDEEHDLEREGTTHSETLPVTAGTHDYTVTCDHVTRPSTTETYTLTIDDQPPGDVNITTDDYICGGDALDATFEAEDNEDGSGIDHYNYTIEQQGDTLDEGEADDGVSVAIIQEEGSEITITAKAVDKAGNEGPEKTRTATYTTPEDPHCDRTPPETWADTEPAEAGEGINVTIRCEDAGSGCAENDQAKTYTLSPTEDCDTANTTAYTGTTRTVGQPFTLRENAKLCWYVEDQAQPPNQGFGDTSLTGDLGITLEEPQFGISPDKEFAFSVSTAQEATCKHAEHLDQYDDRNDQQLYNSIPDDREFDTTGGTTHTVTGFDELSTGAESRTVDWLVTCTSNDGELYGSETYSLGYDTTGPNITITAEPNPLVEPDHDHATLTIETDEPALCTYLQPASNPYPLPGMTPVPYRYNFNDPDSNSHTDLDDRDQYQTSYQTRIPEDDAYFLYTGAYTTYLYDVTCTNLAGREARATEDVIVDPPNGLAVTIHTPNQVSTNNVRINATTVLQAECTYSIDGAEAQTLRATDENHHHETNTRLEDRKNPYRLVINCQSTTSAQLSGSAEKSIRVDTKPPTRTNITAVGATCGLDEAPSIRMQSSDGDGTGIHHYEYELTAGGETETRTTSQERIELPLSTPLQQGDTYQVKARAVDDAGNQGAWSKEATIEATDENDIRCDETAPTGWPERQDTSSGADITIHCTDDESGCADSYEYALINQGQTCDDAQYQSSSPGMTGDAYDEPVTITQDQRLCWRVKDEAGNTYTPGQPLDITVSLDIEAEEPSFGIGAEETYRLAYTTSRAAECKIGFLNPNHPSTLSEWYGQLPIAFDRTGGSRHVIENFSITEAGATACQGEDECTQAMAVICTENDRYHYTVDRLGYDKTAPSLNARARPNPVREPGNLQSTLYAESDDDVWCRYERDDTGESESFSPNPDIEDRTQYKPDHEKHLGYFTPPAEGETSYTAPYKVTCVNLAGTQATRDVDLTVAPTNEVGITIHTPAKHDTRSVTLNATTDLEAECTYTFNPDHPPKKFHTTGGTSHVQSHGFRDDGTYTLSIACEAVSGPYAASTTKKLAVDSTGPKMLDIIAQDQTCSLTELEAKLVSNATIIGLDAYNYTITDARGEALTDWTLLPATGTATATETFTLTAGETYTWQAQAIDEFGRKSSILSKSVQAEDESHPDCDFEDPTAILNVEDVYGGVDAYVECQDDGTGCTEYYDFQHALQDCNDSYQSYPYTQRPITLETSGTACAKVYDQAGNDDTASESFTIIAHCSNGLRDPEEEGVDCGGPCPASCDTCNNGKQDPDEEGVDCGGVCPQSCSSSCGNGYVEPGEECDGQSGLTCEELGFTGGTTSCEHCRIDTGDCQQDQTGYCGDGTIDPGEDCDGDNLAGLTCEDFGLTNGELSCDNCKADTSTCEGLEDGYCGDGIIGSGETCDGDNLAGLTCEDFGLTSGELSCTDCEVDTSGCYSGYCGDGEIDQGESCDGLNWGDVETCEDIADTFTGGMPTCRNCHFDTSTCQGTEPECLSDDDCGPDEECEDYECIDVSPEPEDGSEGQDDNYTRPPSTPPEEDHTLGLVFLIAGLVFMLGGGGYLAYTTFINPPPTPAQSQQPSPQQPQQPQEDPAAKAARLEEERRKRRMQEEARRRAQREKEKQRRSLLSSFKNDELSEKGSSDGKEASGEESGKAPAEAAGPGKASKPEPAAEQPATKKQAPKKPAGKDVFDELSTLSKQKPQASLATTRTNKEIFKELSELSGSSHNRIQTTLRKGATSDAIARLFENAQKRDVKPTTITPVFKELISKGKLEHHVAHQAVHKLAEADKLTENQKTKILDDLEALKEGK
ncbi:MAG: hypothetical protein ACLFO2_00455 [Candidatus Woesearchaeota archaeon]